MTQMTKQQFHDECAARIGINEGVRTTMYHDSMGIPTIGIGFNLQRSDSDQILKQIGSSLSAVIGGQALSLDQVHKLFAYSLEPVESGVRELVPNYDKLSDARRFVLIDMRFNLGQGGLADFANTLHLINSGYYVTAAIHIENSTYASQVGDRALRNVAMMKIGAWVSATGNGS